MTTRYKFGNIKLSQQDYKPNSVLCDYLSVRDITIGIKRTTFNRLSSCAPIVCFVLAPNKDLAVSFLHFCKTYPCGYLCLSALASLFAPRTLLWTAVSRYYFTPPFDGVVFGLSSLAQSFRIVAGQSLILPGHPKFTRLMA